MPIFPKWPNISSVLFGQDKQNFVFFLDISVCLKKRASIYLKIRSFEGLSFTKRGHYFVAEMHRSHRLSGNNEF